eukprot:13188328-Heterocapsa_arctica.AAC.1
MEDENREHHEQDPGHDGGDDGACRGGGPPAAGPSLASQVEDEMDRMRYAPTRSSVSAPALSARWTAAGDSRSSANPVQDASSIRFGAGQKIQKSKENKEKREDDGRQGSSPVPLGGFVSAEAEGSLRRLAVEGWRTPGRLRCRRHGDPGVVGALLRATPTAYARAP